MKAWRRRWRPRGSWVEGEKGEESGGANAHQHLAEFHRGATFHQDLHHLPSHLRLQLVHELHRLQDANRLACADAGAQIDEGRLPRSGRPVKRAHHRGCDGLKVAAAGRGGWRGRGRGSRCGDGRLGKGGSHGGRGCHNSGKIASHLQAEIIGFESKFLNVALAELIKQIPQLLMVELHGAHDSLPR